MDYEVYSIHAQTANEYGGDKTNINGLTFGRSSLSLAIRTF